MAGNLTNMIASIFSGSAVTADPYYEYTTLLLPGSGTNGAQNNTFLDGSTNNFTITRNGNTTQGTFSPFSQTGWGNYFDGATDYLSVANNAALNLGSSNYTIECWFYAPSAPTANDGIFTKGNTTSVGTEAWSLEFVNSSGNIGFGVGAFNSFASYLLSSSTAATLNAWNHIAVVRNGTAHTMYLNGASVATATASYTVTSAGSLYLGTGWYAPSTRDFIGYISNARLVIGTAVYTSNFTPPTAPLTAISGTSLLTCQSNRFIDNSTNNFTITVNGDTRVVASSPFNPTASWSAATYGGSGYFDGSGDYLSVANNAALSYGTGAFTIEGFFYTSATNQYGSIFSDENSSGTAGLTLLMNPTVGNGQLVLYGNGTLLVTATGKYNDNAWHHFAISRDSTNLRLYVDGVYIGASASGSTNFDASQPLFLMTSPIAGRTISGYLSSFRTIKGTALYTGTSSITVPTAPLTAITNTSLLLNFTNAGVYDATSKNDLETVGDAQISNTTAKWGSTSIKFDGTGDWLDALASNQLFNLSSGDWTIEAWIYRNASGATHTILNLFNASANNSGLTFYVNASNQLVTDNGTVAALAAGTVASGQWVHVAIVRSGGTTTGYVDGTSVGTTTQAPAASQYARIGALASGFNLFNGYTQDLRITRGYARYVTGTGANAGKMVFNGTNNLALPTAAFPTL